MLRLYRVGMRNRVNSAATTTWLRDAQILPSSPKPLAKGSRARTVVSLVLITRRRRVTAPRQVASMTSKPGCRNSLVRHPFVGLFDSSLHVFVRAAMYGKRVREKVQNDQVFIGWKH